MFRRKPAAPEKAKEILLIEDDARLVTILAGVLGDAGYRVTVAGNGRFAGEILDRRSPGDGYNAAVIDFRLPDMDGTEIARRIQETYPGMKIVIITGDPDPVRRMIDSNNLPWRLMTKPFRGSQLLEQIVAMTGATGAAAG